MSARALAVHSYAPSTAAHSAGDRKNRGTDRVLPDARTGTGTPDRTLRSIQVGNFLHKTAVLAGVGCLSCLAVRRLIGTRMMAPLGAVSTGSALLYGLFVQPDPLSKYQVDEAGNAARELPTGSLSAKSAYVMVSPGSLDRLAQRRSSTGAYLPPPQPALISPNPALLRL